MKEKPAYERDPFLRDLETKVLEVGAGDGRAWAVLEDTIFYPGGGGQPSDRGRIGGAEVLQVEKREDRILHFLDRPVEKGPVRLVLDWERRWDHMQQHTAQHLLTALAADRFGWETRAFHMGPDVCDIDLDVSALSKEDRWRLEDAAAREIRASRPVRARYVEREDLPGLGVRSRGLPEGHTGPVRLVEIEGVDLNTCGGTHLPDTARIGVLVLLGTEPVKGGTRLYFTAGERVRRRFGRREETFAGLRSLLGVPDEEVLPALEERLEKARLLARERKAFLEETVRLRAEALAARPGPVTAEHFEGRDLSFLSLLGSSAAGKAPEKVFFLTAGKEGEGFLLLVSGKRETVIQEAGREAARILEGRGGGRGGRFQGKVARLSRREEALEAVRRILAREA